MRVRVTKPNPHANAQARTGDGTLEGKAPASYAPVEGKPWVYVRWDDGSITTEPAAHVKKIKQVNQEEQPA